MIRAAIDPDQARVDARDILGGRQYRSDPAPRPFRGPLRWLSDRIESATDFIGRLLAPIPLLVWLAIAGALIGLLVWYLVRNAERRRVRVGAGGGSGGTGGPTERDDADALERAADTAEREGDFERAVRLRFRAGLLRLGARGTIDYQPSITNGEVRRALHSPTFDELAETFDEIAYGERDAREPDAAASRRRWPELLRGGRR